MSIDVGRIQAIVRAVSEIPDAAARGAALDRACGNDPELRHRVEALLRERETPAAPGTKANTNPGDAATVPPRASIKGADKAEGLLLAGRYRIGKEIARGGMGKVNWATDELFNREVVVKFMLASPLQASEMAQRFRHEAQVTARLQHPGIPPVHDLGTDDNGRPFLVMKLIHGHTLQKHLDERQSPDEELPRWIHVFEQVARTVGFAHSKNIVHRDLKPLNIMLGMFGEVQVMDWGLAKDLGKPAQVQQQAAENLTRAGQVLGTLQYMPPEQARGELQKIDARADVFALGAILCEILTGSPPYQAETEIGVLAAAAEADLGKAHAALENCGADDQLITLAIRCLWPTREDRPANGTEVADAVAEYRAKVERRSHDASSIVVADSGFHNENAVENTDAGPSGPVIQLGAEHDATTLPPRAEPRQQSEFPFLAPPRQPNEIGYLGPYRVLGVLGAGGMGAVFRAEDSTLRRHVALKVMLPDCARDPTAKARFLREARAQAAVDHDHIIPIYQVGEEGTVPFIVMPLLKGEMLADALRAKPVQPIGEAVRIAREMALGLAAAHAQGLIHRDIKPANIWLEGPARRVKILDFGLARTEQDASGSEQLTEFGMVVGTPAYMSPEQTSGEPLDGRTDLFSLGTVLHQMLTGRQPFTGKTPTAILVAVSSYHPPRPSELNPLVPPALDELAVRLLAKNPARRPTNAQAVAEELGLIASQLSKTTESAVGPTPPAELPSQQGSESDDRTDPERQAQPLASNQSDKTAPVPVAKRDRKPWIIAAVGIVLLLLVGIAAIISDRSGTKSNGDPPPLPFPPPPLPKPPLPTPPPLAELLASPDWEWGSPENLGKGVNTAYRELVPTLTSDERTLVFARNEKLWISTRRSINEQFGKAELLPASVNTQLREEVSMSGDGLLLAITTSRGGTSGEIWLSERKSRDEPFGEPVRLDSPVNQPQSWSVNPVLSSDGLTLLTTVNRRSGFGGGDIAMYTRKTRAESFEHEQLFPVPVNTQGHDIASWISNDRRVLLRTRMDKSETRFLSRLSENEPFGPPQLLNAINPHRPWLSPDGMRMYFHSREVPGGQGELDLWVVHRVPKKK